MRIGSRLNKLPLLALGLAFALGGQQAHAQDTIKVGVIAAFSGPFADYGGQIEAGMKAYMKQHGDTVAGKKVELITRDTKGPAPEVAKRFAQELITRDHVQFLAGFGLTPNAMAVAPVVSRGEGADGHLERGDLVDHDQVAVHHARVDDHSADRRAAGAVGAQERHQAGLHGGGRLRSRHRRGDAVHEDVQGRRRADRRLGAHAAAESRLLGRDAAGQGREAAGGVRVPAGGPAGHLVHEELQRARPGRSGDQADRHRRHHRRPRARGDGRADARHDHRVPLLGGAQVAGERGVPEGVRRRRTTPRPARRTSWRPRATTRCT